MNAYDYLYHMYYQNGLIDDLSIENINLEDTGPPIIEGNNIITYTASNKLYETTGIYTSGLHINEFNVSIIDHIFANGIGTIIFSGDVTSIGAWAFFDCTGLTSITIPNSVTSIGAWAFAGCSGMTSITIPNSVTSIGRYAFSGCTGLTSITIPSSVTAIEERTFYGCTGLTSITIPNNVTEIEEDAFDACTGLTCVTINSSSIVEKDYL